ncbi:MAG: hypothetical protein M3R01_07775 [Actinomycetota bacterium]|nr:hypothetical protein [Acidimicrobiia bacterium]MDQ3146819.1 hypothetical protein [Actinomycetota bacterium]
MRSVQALVRLLGNAGALHNAERAMLQLRHQEVLAEAVSWRMSSLEPAGLEHAPLEHAS